MEAIDTAEDPEAHRSAGPDGRAVRAAVAYYMEKKTMDAVARELHTSRATVSRLLSRAREEGTAEIKVHQPGARASELSTAIGSTFGVAVTVVPLPDEATIEQRHERTADAAARRLHEVINSDDVLAVAWGTMTNAISLRLRPKAVTNCHVAQVNGQGNSTSLGVHYAHAMMDRYGRAYGASVQERPLPLFFDSPGLARALEGERLISHSTQLIEKADIFLFNVGTVNDGVPNAPHLHGNYLGDKDFRRLQEDHAVGDIATTFFDEDGESAHVRLNELTSGPDLDALRGIPRRICATAGMNKIHALHGALVGRRITELIVDEHTARALLDAYPHG